jgi:hypothetical protein
LTSELQIKVVVDESQADWSGNMVGSAFTTKKMKLERKSWLRKSMIGTAIVAVLSAGGFGAYKLTDTEEPSHPTSQRNSSNNRVENSLPKFASSMSMNQSISGKRKHATHAKTAKPVKKSKIKKLARHGKHKGQKLARHGKHKGHKLTVHKKHGKHHVAHNKKHHSKHVAKHGHKSKHSNQSRHIAAD